MPPSADDLRAELRAYVRRPEEDSIVERFLRLLEGGADSFARSNTDHVTGSAIIARQDGNAFLLRYHRKLRRWLQPGGHVEPEDRSVFETALREAREETGIEEFDTSFGEHALDFDVHDIPRWRLLPAHVHFDVRFLLIAPPQARASDLHRTRWVSFDDVPSAEAEPSLARAIEKARRRLSVARRNAPGGALSSLTEGSGPGGAAAGRSPEIEAPAGPDRTPSPR